MDMVQALNKLWAGKALMTKFLKKLNCYDEKQIEVEIAKRGEGICWQVSFSGVRYFCVFIKDGSAKLIWFVDIKRMMNNANGYY